ncbi:hypothetical protein D7Y16_06220 [Stenotrophomonas maltophilia]|nr:hypothetical protein [Stenotrophomonas maltophilia]MBA0247466.1 hypothetical protein [Stenotrophomonas maltophilia]MBA0306433.1 hypothetical protein [Stenotrophomonas maltophilia]MBA0439045.1 hypothetical protein [Stenotrophomonas maltophilia]MBA0515880.1 hypothetical protein [Stenotrophomonas maltophilia]
MDAAAKPPWTGSRRPRTPTPPRHPTDSSLWLLPLPLLEALAGAGLQALPKTPLSVECGHERIP